jgi:D-glycero-D-manno-heptose 1,7-bisphosphate phosphatase
MTTRAVFLDRDGTLMVDVGYPSRPDQVELLPEVTETLIRLKKEGYLLIIVTNQSGIGRGYFTEDDFWAVERTLELQLGENLIDAVYFCPDTPERATERRKPSPGMLLEAAERYGLDLAESFLIGDKMSDIEAGLHAGLKLSILVDDRDQRTGLPAGVSVAASFSEAGDLLLASRS